MNESVRLVQLGQRQSVGERVRRRGDDDLVNVGWDGTIHNNDGVTWDEFVWIEGYVGRNTDMPVQV